MVFGNKDQEQAEAFAQQVAAWPVKRESEGDMTEEEKRAVAETKKVWPLAKDYMDKADMWKKEKEVVEEGEQGVGKIELFTAKCPTLSHKVFKVTVELECDWKSVYEILMATEDNPSWNVTLEECKVVAQFPPQTDLQDGSTWITYMRVHSKASNVITQRDFVSCFIREVTEDHATWIGSHCDIPLCPQAPKLVRAEQNILVMHVQKLTEDTCLVTQITSISFNGLILQSIIDSQMGKSQTKYAKNLKEKVKREKHGLGTINKSMSPLTPPAGSPAPKSTKSTKSALSGKPRSKSPSNRSAKSK